MHWGPFMARGRQYGGTDTIYQLPGTREGTVYYLAADPRDNGLSRNRLKSDTLALAGLAFVVAIVAHWPEHASVTPEASTY
jgi:hypothetical protein